MKIKSYIFFIFLFSISITFSCKIEDANNLDKNISINKSGLKSLLSANKGNIILLNFWATWCPSCKPELKILSDLQKKYEKKGLKVICIAVDPAEDEMDTALIKLIYQNSGALFGRFISSEKQVKDIMTIVDKEWLEIVPVTYLINKNGDLQKRFVGSRSIQELKTSLENELK